MSVMRITVLAIIPVLVVLGGLSTRVSAEQLYDGSGFANVAGDNKAQGSGDIVTILIAEAASATNRVGTRSGRQTGLDAGLSVGSVDESLSFGIDSKFHGLGETERSDRFAASMTATVIQVLPNGNLQITGKQHLFVNGEKREIEVRGEIRPVDVSSDNTIISTRIANAEINYDGQGFATRSAKPGLLNRIFSFLGL